MRLAFCLILLLPFSQFSYAQGLDNKDTCYTILRTAILTRQQSIESEVAKKFGFKYKTVPMKSTETEYEIIYPNLDSIKHENARTYKLIAHRNGRNWRKKFNKEVDRSFNNWIAINSFLEDNPELSVLRDTLNNDKSAYGFDFDVEEELQRNNIFIVVYFLYRKENGKSSLHNSKKLEINLKKRAVKIL